MTLRASFRPLRCQHVFPTLRLAIAGAAERAPTRFRILHFSVQFDHVHLIVEAADGRELSAGLRSLVIRMARAVNALVGRKGRVWADRWHGRALTSPRQVRNALLYVLANVRRHARGPLPAGIDVYSSGRWFDGWRRDGARRHALKSSEQRAGPSPVNAPGTWLARTGWRKRGLLGIDEVPARG